MSVIGSNILAGASGQGGVYTIDRSLRLRSSASAYLNRTPASAGNRKTWTYSIWFKYAGVGTQQMLGGAGTSGNETYIQFLSTGELQLRQLNSSTQTMLLQTSQVFRDPSAWYHIVIEVDTTQATSSDRIKIYINGSQITAFSTASYYSLNYDSHINNNVAHYFGRRPSSGSLYFDGYLTEVNFIDGQALDPTSFGEYNEDTGVWQPIKYTGTYGTNGFYLNFSDNSTTTTLGYDYSGNSNNWTANNISVTSGATYDSMTDVPTLTSEDAANYAVMNPLDSTITDGSITNGNLTLNGTSNWNTCRGNWGMSAGKWYWETAHSVYNQSICGIADSVWPTSTYYPGYTTTGYSASYFQSGSKRVDGVTSTYGDSFIIGDVIGYALDMDAGTLTCYKNGVSQGVMVTGLTAYGTIFPALAAANGAVINANFGQRPFAYTPPTGFKSLNTYNLPDSTIVDGGEYFNTVLYTGTNANLPLSGFGFSPDLIWIKNRDGADDHKLVDSVRGSNLSIESNTTAAELNATTIVFSIDSDGFTVGSGNVTNGSGEAFVAWNWKANGSGVTNNEGTIESTVSANPTAGFSIVTYTGNGTAGATVGHGLGVAPNMVIVKTRDSDNTWRVGHDGLTSWAYQLRLDDPAGQALNNNIFNSTAPTSTVFTVGSSATTNESTKGMVAYCFASIEGYSKFGKYTGNGSATGDGPFVYLGFRPAFVMVKRTDSTSNWIMFDDKRLGYNPNNDYVYADLTNPDGTADLIDLTSNGFKIRSTSSAVNTSNGTYIYMAFAENPFKNALAR